MRLVKPDTADLLSSTLFTVFLWPSSTDLGSTALKQFNFQWFVQAAISKLFVLIDSKFSKMCT